MIDYWTLLSTLQHYWGDCDREMTGGGWAIIWLSPHSVRADLNKFFIITSFAGKIFTASSDKRKIFVNIGGRNISQHFLTD